jgi:hypothetical protein
MSAKSIFDPTDDAGYRMALRTAARQGISLAAERREGVWTVIATRLRTGIVSDASGAQVTFAAWQALELLKQMAGPPEPEQSSAPRPRPTRVSVPLATVTEAYELLTAYAEEGIGSDRQQVLIVAAELRAIIAKAAGRATS